MILSAQQHQQSQKEGACIEVDLHQDVRCRCIVLELNRTIDIYLMAKPDCISNVENDII